ncbi:PQQ-like beta-propeller repeat protein [bacterium]|nr:PQQ-like beta-propeller repeat protein [bacterium]MCB2202227.1 PQQ-like beta-propeller repeat protein [bacterium]
MLRRILVALSLSLLMLPGCSSKYKLHRSQLSGTTPWPYFRGNSAASGATTGTFEGKLEVLWEHRTNGKLSGPMTIYYNTLFYPSTRKRVEFFDLQDGGLQGKLKTKGYMQAGLILDDTLAFYALAPKKDRVHGVNLLNQKDLWQRPVKDAAAGTILVNNSLIIGSSTGEVLALDPLDGSIRWKFGTESRIAVPASAGYGLIFQPVDGNEVIALDDTDGTERYRVSLKAPVAAPVALGNLACVADIGGTVTAFDPEDGTVVWQQSIGQPIWAAPAVSGTTLIVGNSGGQIIGLDANSGVIRWTFETHKVVRAAPLLVGSFVVAANLAGEVFVLNAQTGDLVDQATLKGAVEHSPVTDGRLVIVATDKGYITCFGESDEQNSRPADQRVHSQDGS